MKSPNNEPDAVRFGMELSAPTHEGRQAEYQANWRKAEQAVAAGRVICISDLMAQAEQLHIEHIERPRKRATRLDSLLSQAKASRGNGYQRPQDVDDIEKGQAFQ